MAAGTTSGYAAVIESGPCETIGVMAVVAGITALDMVSGFARCRIAVMATDTTALNFGMIHPIHR